MTSKASILGLVSLVALCGGCAGQRANPAIPSGSAAYEVVPDQVNGFNPGAIAAGDHLAIRVLGEPDLSSDEYWVDGAGHIQLPLVGDMNLTGLTPENVRLDLEKRLGQTYLRNPHVAISIVEHAQFGLTVEGEVQKAGRFEATPGTTLLGALALAQSTSKDAKLNEVYIFREMHGRKAGARFDLGAIRKGLMPDPQILPGDVVVVGRSAIKSAWHDFLLAAPAFALYYYLK